MDLGRAVLDLDGDSGLAGATAEVVKAGLHHFGLTLDLDFVDVRRVDREHPLDAFAIADATNREGLVDAVPLTGDDDAGVNLDALFVALADFRVHAHAVADFERRDVFFHLRSGDCGNDRVHG